MTSFIKNIKKYRKCLKSKHTIFLFLTFILGLASLFLFDKFIIPHNKTFDVIFSIVKENYSYIFVIICLFLAFSFFNRKYKSKLVREIITIFIVICVGYLLKFIFARPRQLPDMLGYSFPSNHALITSSLLPFFKSWHYYVWLFICIFISFSRVYWQYHYFSDIFFGAFIGYSIGLLIKKIKKLDKTKKNRKQNARHMDRKKRRR